MVPGMDAFQKANPNRDVINEAFTYDVRTLDTTDGSQLSQYTIALSQWLIFYKYNYNKTKIEISRQQRLLDTAVTLRLTKELAKEYKTKADAYFHIVQADDELMTISNSIDYHKDELLLLEGIDKTISELIASIKRELTRRENELWQTKKER